MLRLQSDPRNARAPERTVENPVLGISWLNGDLRVCAGPANAPRIWSASGPISDAAALGPVLRTALAHVRFGGRDGCLALAHPQLAQIYTDLPPSSSLTARRLMERQVDKQKPFAGEAVWCAQSAFSANARSCILHVISRELHDTLVGSCREAGINLTRLTPVSELAVGCVPQASCPDEAILAAVEIPKAVLVNANRADGIPLLRRTLHGSWAEDHDRIMGEIRRTVMFVRQQHQLPTGKLWLSGTGVSAEILSGLAPAATLGAHRLPNAPGPEDWANKAREPGLAGVNLITREQREARHRKVVSRWSRGVGWLVLVAACGWAAFAQRLRQQELANRVRLEREVADVRHSLIPLRAAEEALGQRLRLIEAREQSLRPPVQKWLLGCLASALPDGLVVTNLGMTAASNGWRINLSGWVAPAGSHPTEAVHQFTSALARGPLALSLAPRSLEDRTSEPPAGPGWTRRLAEPTPQLLRIPTPFDLEGIVE